jgi:hypothetical protein
MMPRGPLADDWLYWDPLAMHTYPHSCSPRAIAREPEQLELFASPNAGEPAIGCDERSGRLRTGRALPGLCTRCGAA